MDARIEDDSNGNGHGEASEPAATVTLRKETTLRQLQRSELAFWDPSRPKHLLPVGSVVDQVSFGNKRSLGENEIAVMALNEIAAQQRRGFFFHFRNRDTWKKATSKGVVTEDKAEGADQEEDQEELEQRNGGQTQAELWPASRRPEPPGADYPDLVYMNFVWDETTRDSYLATSHRSRHLKSDGFINPPPVQTPLYSIQYAANFKYPLYKTTAGSLIIVANATMFCIGTDAEIEAIVGPWPRSKKQPQGVDSDRRLDTATYFWRGASKGSDVAAKAALEELGVSNIKLVYDEIVRKCRPSDMAASFTCRELHHLLPRPVKPEVGLPLGTPLAYVEGDSNDLVSDSSNPPSRKRIRKEGKGKSGRGPGLKQSTSDADGKNDEGSAVKPPLRSVEGNDTDVVSESSNPPRRKRKGRGQGKDKGKDNDAEDIGLLKQSASDVDDEPVL